MTEPTTSLPAEPELSTTSTLIASTTTTTATSTSTTVKATPPPTAKITPATTVAPTTTESPTYRPTMQWFAAHGALLDAIQGDDNQRLAAGTKWTVLATVCARYQADVATLTAALPLPNTVVNAEFQRAANLLRGGANRCIAAAGAEDYAGYTTANDQYFNPGIVDLMNAASYRNQERLPT